MTDLIMFSGGIDSTFLAYDSLLNTNNNVHLHHIKFKNHDILRSESELKSIPPLLEYFKKIRSFTYTDSTFEFSQFEHAGYDGDVAAFIGGKVSTNIKDSCVRVFIAINMDDTYTTPIQLRYEENYMGTIFDMILKSMADRRNYIHGKPANKVMTLTYPLLEQKLHKRDIMKIMPQELIDLTWSCRTPIGLLQPCNKCISCLARST